MKKLKKPVLFLIVSCLVFGVTFFFSQSLAANMSDFRNNLWGPLRLLSQQKSPYNLSPLFPGKLALWFPMAHGVFFPLGFMPLSLACCLWMTFNILLLIACITGMIVFYKPSAARFVLATAFILCFPFTIRAFFNGQVTVLIIFSWTAIACYHERVNLWVQFGLIYLALTKPQLSVLLVPIFMVSLYRRKGLPQTIIQSLKSLILPAFILSPVFYLYPGWISDFVKGYERNPKWLQPSVVSILSQVDVLAAWTVTVLMYIGSLFLLCRGMEKHGFRLTVLAAMAVTPVVTPYVWSYDFILILPLFIHVFLSLKSIHAMILQSVLFCATSGIVYYLTATRVRYSDEHYWWISWVLVATIFACLRLDARMSNISSPGSSSEMPAPEKSA